MRIKYFFLTFLCTCVLFINSISGQKISTHQILGNALKSDAVLTLNQTITKWKDQHFTLPMVEKIDLRTETERFVTPRQDFLARFSFNSLAQRKATRQKLDSWVDWKKSDYEKWVYRALLERYEAILMLWSIESKLVLAQEKLALIKERIRKLELALAAGEAIDLDDYILAKSQAIEEENKQTQFRLALQDMYKQVQMSDQQNIDTVGLISIKQIKSYVDSLRPDFSKHVFLYVFEAEKSFFSSSIEVEKAEQKKILNFGQIAYTSRDDLIFENRLSVGFGFLFPWNSGAKFKEAELNLRKQENELDHSLTQISLMSKFDIAKQNFSKNYRYLSDLSAVQNDPNIRYLKEQSLQTGLIDIAQWYKIKESEINLRSKIIEIKHQLMTDYLEVLSTSGVMYQKPYKNYLDALMLNIIQ